MATTLDPVLLDKSYSADADGGPEWATSIIRSGEGLREAVAWLESIEPGSTPDHELRNVHQVAWLIAQCALVREESRGGHFRSDFPEKDPKFATHSVISQ